ncbi:MAG: MarR family transcriptional regulator, partial [Bdellovibrionales bacterium]|nr:MarR family transcriptional regulator [Bdellovibrionales bacterium]
MENNLKAIYLKIHVLLLAFQRRARAYRRTHSKVYLPNSETHILVQLDSNPGISAKELAEILTLEKSTISRLIQSLEKRNLLSSTISANDRRTKLLRLTHTGSSILKDIDEAVRDTIVRFLNVLTTREESRLHYYISMLADGFNAKPHKIRPIDHPISVELRRYTRGVGML